MRVEVKAPTLPESITEATLLSWHKQAGDNVARDENLVDIETEKVVLEVPAPQTGILKEVLKRDGDVVGSDEPIAIIETDAGDTATAKAASQEKPAQATSLTPAGDKRPVAAAGDEASAAEPPLSPAVRRLLAEHNLAATQIPATGRGGRLTKEDVQNYLRQRDVNMAAPASAPSATPATPTPEPPAAPGAPAPEAPTPAGERRERRVTMTRLRATIAERLLHAQHAAALLTTFNEVNMQAVIDLRQKYREHFEKQYKVRLGFMSFFVKASVQALQQFPVVNALVDDKDIVYHDYYDIGIAVAGPRGLVVPVLRDTDRMSFAEIEIRIGDFAKKAGDGSLSMDELTGGTFTITNGGIFGSLVSTPLINPPQSAILGMHKIQQRPVAEDNEVRIRPMMYLALTYDHRIIDGREAVKFLVRTKEALEDPARLLLHI
ncbi:MAG: 2-oxoglutarate dehydrogenase complex dihydrolipoyllysine-residue succinyltransferase [Acidiferrobacterales bacterium]